MLMLFFSNVKKKKKKKKKDPVKMVKLVTKSNLFRKTAIKKEKAISEPKEAIAKLENGLRSV